MKARSRAVLVAALISGAFGLAADPASATIIFDWSGTCSSNCSGTASVTLTLTDSYMFGTTITPADVLSIAYESNTITADAGGEPNSTSGGINADGSLSSSPVIIDYGLFTFSDSTGAWSLTNSIGGTPDSGTNGVFTLQAPEPFTLSLFGAGLAGAAAMRRRKAKQ